MKMTGGARKRADAGKRGKEAENNGRCGMVSFCVHPDGHPGAGNLFLLTARGRRREPGTETAGQSGETLVKSGKPVLPEGRRNREAEGFMPVWFWIAVTAALLLFKNLDPVVLRLSGGTFFSMRLSFLALSL